MLLRIDMLLLTPLFLTTLSLITKKGIDRGMSKDYARGWMHDDPTIIVPHAKNLDPINILYRDLSDHGLLRMLLTSIGFVLPHKQEDDDYRRNDERKAIQKV